MKIHKQGASPYAGTIHTCGRCECEFELEDGDRAYQMFQGQLPEVDQWPAHWPPYSECVEAPLYTIPCPYCGTIHAFVLSDKMRRRPGRRARKQRAAA